MADDAVITASIVALFVIGMLWSGWINNLHAWIAGKVNEK